jgi:hypothetical protein
MTKRIPSCGNYGDVDGDCDAQSSNVVVRRICRKLT